MTRALPWALRWAMAVPLLLMPMALHAQSMLSPSAEACLSCHRTTPDHAALPSLAGQSSADIHRALMEFRAGTRPATIMNRVAKGYSDDEMRALADEIAKFVKEAKR